ncbi:MULTISPECIES: ExbD/TolR family protein [Roseobacteraceae]|uniref:Biopolymer transport protein ExbD/TolR n=1 Tax=Pseudosulfitobacter pseudonitzschiae TaxID=1402135 RepID=A0A221JYD6_9RHOB|nr:MULTISPECIES: biopolymer transporter ExbD [Roseobacteraceae]ASM71746.1 biopolymer transport protein ExbD/TolR [Pseudosulfitobacter pseudonitzschiae]
MRVRRKKSEREPTIALINIVFLMLVFFMVAGTLAAPLDPELKLVETANLQGEAPADALVIGADGTLTHRGQPVDVAGFFAAVPAAADTARMIPDRAASAHVVIETARALRAAGAARVVIVTEKALQ